MPSFVHFLNTASLNTVRDLYTDVVKGVKRKNTKRSGRDSESAFVFNQATVTASVSGTVTVVAHYNYQQDPAAGGGQQGDLENPLAALLAGIRTRILDFNTEELEALLRDLPVPDDTRQPAGMTMAEAVEVSDTL